MNFEKKAYSVKELVDAWNSGSMVRNPEYQRGEAWTLTQKQALVDSLFRHYPIPPLFLEKKMLPGLGGAKSEKYEIIDGQQRRLAISEYFAGSFPLLAPTDKRLKLPVSLRPRPAGWADRRYLALDADLRHELDNAKVDVFQVSKVDHADEVRDLFIRLQSGTALTRQQIRDAWPGTLGPFVESLAGKLNKRPRFELFELVDGRGLRDEEGDAKDPYVKHRQTCAQLMRIMLGRMAEPFEFPSISAGDLDGLYHEFTDIDPEGDSIRRVLQVFEQVEEVSKQIGRQYLRKYKIHKQGMFALCLFFQDSFRNPNFKMDQESIRKLAKYVTVEAPKAEGKSSSAASNAAYYEKWRSHLPEGIGLKLDAKRLFDDAQKAELHRLAGGKCVKCDAETTVEDGEADHFPVPHRDGGPTSIENGRFVCKICHPRGRPRLETLA